MKEWHCVLYGQPQGPFAEDRLREMAGKGEIAEETLVWSGSTPEDVARGWIKAGESEIASILAEKPTARNMADAVAQVQPRTDDFESREPAPGVFESPRFQQLALSQGVVLQEGWQFKASRLRRFVAFVLDIVILLAFSVVFMAAPILVLRGESLSLALNVFIATVVSFAVYGVINFVLLHRTGQSISKNIAGVRIVNADGSRTPLWKIIVLRNGVYIALCAALGVSAVAAQGVVNELPVPPPDFQLQLAIATGVFFFLDSCLIMGKSRRTLHDVLAGTIVVDA